MTSMFAYPWWLAAALAVVALGALYVVMVRRRKTRALRFGNLQLLSTVTKGKRDYLTHVPFALLVVGLLLLVVASAGPVAMREVPRDRATVMLVVDVSRSMEATDVSPSRLEAAQQAGKQFADDLTDGINLGLISFAATPATLVSPTANHDATKEALGKLTLADKTATGEGILAALEQIKTLNAVLGGSDHAPPAHIVLLSDGKQTVPESPDDPRGGFSAARMAKEAGIPVSTISFGTDHGVVTQEINGRTEQIPVPVDDASLRKIAELSGGKFYTAQSLAELNEVYSTLQRQIGTEMQRGDNSRPWLIGGTAVILVALAIALALNRRIP